MYMSIVQAVSFFDGKGNVAGIMLWKRKQKWPVLIRLVLLFLGLGRRGWSWSGCRRLGAWLKWRVLKKWIDKSLLLRHIIGVHFFVVVIMVPHRYRRIRLGQFWRESRKNWFWCRHLFRWRGTGRCDKGRVLNKGLLSESFNIHGGRLEFVIWDTIRVILVAELITHLPEPVASRPFPELCFWHGHVPWHHPRRLITFSKEQGATTEFRRVPGHQNYPEIYLLDGIAFGAFISESRNKMEQVNR